MRVIAGSAKGRKLAAPEGMATRPTTDRFKEMLFDVLQFEIVGTRFLDLFSGSGAIGIEALSRGAREAVLVEQDAQALRCIRQNLEHTRLTADARVMAADVLTAIDTLAAEGRRFDLIFLDPPYEKGWEQRVADKLRDSGLLADGGRLVIESAACTPIEPDGWRIVKEKLQKVTKFTFLEKMR